MDCAWARRLKVIFICISAIFAMTAIAALSCYILANETSHYAEISLKITIVAALWTLFFGIVAGAFLSIEQIS